MVLLSKVVMSLTVRTTLSQQQACYYQPFHKHLACMCSQEENLSYLPIKMEYWVRQMAQEILFHKVPSEPRKVSDYLII